jgi:hypothetical protein
VKTLFAIIGVAVVIAIAIFFARPNTMGSAPELSPTGILPPLLAPLALTLAREPEGTPATVPSFWQRPPPRGDFDPMLVMAMGDFSDEEIARYNDLHIVPFNKAIGQECEDLPHPNFVDRTYNVCKTTREFPEHPYGDLNDQALLELAVTDATAALFLGRRVKQEQERLRWYLRAAALSEKSGPLMSLAENRYNSVHALKTVDGELRSVAKFDSVATRIALDTVAQKMGDPRANPGRWQQALREVAGDKAAIYLGRADVLVVKFLESMAHTQRDITGSIQILQLLQSLQSQEVLDNA